MSRQAQGREAVQPPFSRVPAREGRLDAQALVAGAFAAAAVADRERRSTKSRRMKVLEKLQNPWALVAQGFVVGGLIFFATHSASLQARASDATSASPPVELRR